MDDIHIERLNSITEKISVSIKEQEVKSKSNFKNMLADCYKNNAEFITNIQIIRAKMFENPSTEGIDHIPALIRRFANGKPIFFIYDFYREGKIGIACDMGTGFQVVRLLTEIWDPGTLTFPEAKELSPQSLEYAEIASEAIRILNQSLINEPIDRLVDIIASAIEDSLTMRSKNNK